MAALGAALTIIKSDSGGMDEALTRNMIEAAQKIREEHGGFLTDQLNNRDQITYYHDMAMRSGSKRVARLTPLYKA